MFPLYLRSSDAVARQTAIASVTKPLTDRMSKAQKEGNTAEVMHCMRQMGEIRKRAGIKLTSQFVPLVAQGVLGYCGFKLMRACATLPVPGFHDGGFLWLTDLTLSDGYLILPALMAAVMHAVVRFGGETGAQTSSAMTPGIINFMKYGMPVLIFGFTAYQPGAVAVWFASTGLIGITQGQLLQRPMVRDFFGLAPLYKPKPGESSGNLVYEFLKRDEPVVVQKSKNSLYMNHMSYQSPSLKSNTGRTIDTSLSSKPFEASEAEEMIQPGDAAKPKKSILDSVTEPATNFWKKVQTKAEPTPEQQKKAWKKKADEYERKASGKGR